MTFPDGTSGARWLVALALGAAAVERVRLGRRHSAAELDEVCARAAEGAAALLGGEVGLVLRFEADGRGRLIGRSRRALARYPLPGQEMPFEPHGAIGIVRS